MVDPAHLRIGALSRRVGVSPELLRAWEQRYGLLQPVRSSGGFRLYSPADEARIRSMRRHLEAGVSTAQAARLTLAEAAADAGEAPQAPVLERLSSELQASLDRMDERGAHAAIDRLLGTFTLRTVVADVMLPYLRDLGERWERGEVSVGQEHVASSLLRGRLLGLTRGWGDGAGPKAVLACPPGELHDLPLIMFGLVLAGQGWRIAYFGPDTPIATIQETLPEVEPRLVVIASTDGRRMRAAQAQLTELARHVPVALAGAGASGGLARAAGASLLEGDPVSEADRVAVERR